MSQKKIFSYPLGSYPLGSNRIFKIFNSKWSNDKVLIDWVRSGRRGKYLALGQEVWTLLRSVRTPWPRAKYFPVRPSHSVNKYTLRGDPNFWDRWVTIFLRYGAPLARVQCDGAPLLLQKHIRSRWYASVNYYCFVFIAQMINRCSQYTLNEGVDTIILCGGSSQVLSSSYLEKPPYGWMRLEPAGSRPESNFPESRVALPRYSQLSLTLTRKQY